MKTTTVSLPSGCEIAAPVERLLRFCQEEYDYYDAIASSDPTQIEPVDVLATVAVNSFLRDAAAIRRVHRGMANACRSPLTNIPADADLLSFDPTLDHVRALLHAAVQAPGVLIPVATKVLHRKRRSLIPMLDNVVMAYYLGTPLERLPAKTQDKARAADAAIEVLRHFRNDLRSAAAEVEAVRDTLAGAGYTLSPVRILEILVWTQVEVRGYYRED